MYYQLIYNIINNAVSDKIDYANILCPQPSLKYYVYIQNKINEFFEKKMDLCNYANTGQSMSHWIYKHTNNVYYIAYICVVEDNINIFHHKYKLCNIYKASQQDIKQFYILNYFDEENQQFTCKYLPGPYEKLPKK